MIEPRFRIPTGLVEKDRRMSFKGQVDFLEPINLAEHLDKVELYLGQKDKGLNLGAATDAARRFREQS